MKENIYRESPSIDEIPVYMNGWAEKKPGFVKISSIGKSGGYDILKAVFTDPSVPDEDKQVALITAQHSLELSGVTTLLSVGNFLVSDREDAAEILKKQIVVIIPCSNTYCYAKGDIAYQFTNEAGICECFAFRYDNIAFDEATAPVAYAVKRVIDEYRPELMLDVHGVWAKDQMVIETMGVSNNSNNRFYNSEFVRLAQQAAKDAGYAAFDLDKLEKLHQTDVCCNDPRINSRFLPQVKGTALPGTYSYFNYHTLAGSFETCWEESSVAKIIAALRMGCGIWGGEYYSGYPTRNVVTSLLNNSVRAYGTTASKRRKSRVELWQNNGKLRMGVGTPVSPGFATAIICTDVGGTEGIVTADCRMEEAIERMAERYDINKEKMLELLEDEYPLYMGYSPERAEGELDAPCDIKYGMTIRMGLAFADASNYKVYYNGHELSEDEIYGYTVVKHENWVYVDLHIPADKICPFAIAMVKYDCTVPKQGIIEF